MTRASALFAAPTQLTAEQARHFLLRTGFAPTQVEVQAIEGKSAAAVVAQTLAAARASKPLQAAPAFVSQPPPTPFTQLATQEERQAKRREQMLEGLQLKTWWMGEMLQTQTPLQERMTLFWHNHFATSQQKVVRSQAMWNQHLLLRKEALGNFSTLLHAVAKDPAMLVYLDGANSRREAPNENFAREVMELFTLGEASHGGGYTEADIREAARAFTGWSIERETFAFRFRPAFHDTGRKTLLGQTGNFDGDAALDVMLAQDAAARFIVAKLWREFVSPVPNPPELDRIAARFRASGYQISTAVQDLLLSDAFWSADNAGSLVKSPVELIVGTVRQFGFTYTDATPFALKSAQLGQNLLVPPNVKGWPGYTDWINATSLLERKRFTEQLFRAVEQKSGAGAAPVAMAVAVSADLQTPMQPNPQVNMSPDAPTSPGMRNLRAEFGAEKGDKSGQGSNRQVLASLGREGVMQVAQAVSHIKFNPDLFLSAYGARADSELTEEQKSRIAPALLASEATQSIAPGTVGVAWLRSLTLDPAYQLK